MSRARFSSHNFTFILFPDVLDDQRRVYEMANARLSAATRHDGQMSNLSKDGEYLRSTTCQWHVNQAKYAVRRRRSGELCREALNLIHAFHWIVGAQPVTSGKNVRHGFWSVGVNWRLNDQQSSSIKNWLVMTMWQVGKSTNRTLWRRKLYAVRGCLSLADIAFDLLVQKHHVAVQFKL